MRVLVLCDDLWHPGTVVRRGLAALGDCGFEYDFLENGAEWSAARMAEFRLIVLAKANMVSPADQRPWLVNETQSAFQEQLRRGNGLVVIHAGTSRYSQLPVMHRVIGGAFVRHPKQCPVTVEPKAGHPITAGASPFTVQDEHYMMKLDATDTDTFLETRSEHGVQPGGWTRAEGEGRVCVLTPGHNVEVWLHPSFQTLLRNALDWAARRI
jgi:type 1 glutamine amidotransferase